MIVEEGKGMARSKETQVVTLEVSIPTWAKWLAMDADGSWWVYDKKPVPMDSEWDAPDRKMRMAMERVAISIETPYTRVAWEGELYRLG